MEGGRVTRASKQGEKWVGLDMTVWRRGGKPAREAKMEKISGQTGLQSNGESRRASLSHRVTVCRWMMPRQETADGSSNAVTGQAGKAKFAGDLQMRGRYDPASEASVVFAADIRRLNSGVDGKDRNTGSSGRCEKKKGDGTASENWCAAYFRRSQGPGCAKTTSCRSAVARSARDDDFSRSRSTAHVWR